MRQLVDTQIRLRCLSLRDSRAGLSRLLEWVARSVCTTAVTSAHYTPADIIRTSRIRNPTLLRIPFVKRKSSITRQSRARVLLVC